MSSTDTKCGPADMAGNILSTWSNSASEVIGRNTSGKVEPSNFGGLAKDCVVSHTT